MISKVNLQRRVFFKQLSVLAIALIPVVSKAGGGVYYDGSKKTKKIWPHNTIRAVQRRLRELGFNSGSIDGIYGSKTKQAIVEFQQSKNLEIDGEISDNLIRALTVG